MINITNYRDISVTLTLFRMGYFGAAHRWGGDKKTPSLGKVTAYPKKIQKIFKSCDTSWVLLTSAFFHQKSAHFAI